MFQYLEPQFLISALGLVGVFAIVFAESGLFFGFFLPGDSLLFTAGLFASQGYLNISWLIIGVAIAAILGDSVGYTFGKRVGPALFSRDDSFFFHKKHAERARLFYEKYGVKTIILARFVPIVRTFAPIVAGIGGMRYRTFITYNIIGGMLWTLLLTLSGYFLGSAFPGMSRYLHIIVVIIIFISILPIVFEWMKQRRV
ncbi:MAG: VTT domain-containing protein [bacterium]|nr:VTT domain-containing protein [bacterium]